MVKVLSRMLMVALAVVVAANFALAQDGEGKKKGEGKGKRGTFSAEQFVKDNGGVEKDGKWVLTREGYMKAQKEKGRDEERAKGFWNRVVGEDVQQITLDELKAKFEKMRAERSKDGGKRKKKAE